MDNQSKWFLIGLGVGAAAGYLANSDKGRELGDKAREKAADISDEVANQAQEKLSSLKNDMNTVVENGKRYVDSVTKQVKSQFRSAEEAMENTGNEFKRGMEEAKNRMHSSS